MELLYVTVILSFGIVGTASKEISILGQIYDMQVVKTYEMQAPTVLEYRNQNIFMVIRNQAYSTGEDFTQLKMEQTTLRPTVEFTDKLGNIFQRRGRKATLTTEKSGVTTVSIKGSAYCSQFQGDFQRSLVFMLGTNGIDDTGHVYAFNTRKFRIVGKYVETKHLSELGGQITALALHSSSGNIILSEDIEHKTAFNLIMLKPAGGDETTRTPDPQIGRPPKEESAESSNDKDATKKIETATEVKTYVKDIATTVESPTTKRIQIVTVTQSETTAESTTIPLSTTTVDYDSIFSTTDTQNTIEVTTEVNPLKKQIKNKMLPEDSVEFDSTIKQAMDSFIELHNKDLDSRLFSLNNERKRMQVIIQREKFNTKYWKTESVLLNDEEIGSSIQRLIEELKEIYSENILAMEPNDRKSRSKNTCQKDLSILSKQLTAIRRNSQIIRKKWDRSDMESTVYNMFDTYTPLEAAKRESLNGVETYLCAAEDEFYQYQLEWQGATEVLTNA